MGSFRRKSYERGLRVGKIRAGFCAIGVVALLSGCAAGGGAPATEISAEPSVAAEETVQTSSPASEGPTEVGTGYSVCGDYFESQLVAASALNPQKVDPVEVATIAGVALPPAGCAMRITLGNGASQFSLGWDDADIEAFHALFLAAGFVDVSAFATGTGSSYVMSQPGTTASVTLWSGDRVYTQEQRG